MTYKQGAPISIGTVILLIFFGQTLTIGPFFWMICLVTGGIVSGAIKEGSGKLALAAVSLLLLIKTLSMVFFWKIVPDQTQAIDLVAMPILFLIGEYMFKIRIKKDVS